jgi:hypothetical protein
MDPRPLCTICFIVQNSFSFTIIGTSLQLVFGHREGADVYATIT